MENNLYNIKKIVLKYCLVLSWKGLQAHLDLINLGDFRKFPCSIEKSLID